MNQIRSKMQSGELVVWERSTPGLRKRRRLFQASWQLIQELEFRIPTCGLLCVSGGLVWTRTFLKGYLGSCSGRLGRSSGTRYFSAMWIWNFILIFGALGKIISGVPRCGGYLGCLGPYAGNIDFWGSDNDVGSESGARSY